MKTILVTGADGFLGRRLCAVFGERGLSFKALVRDPNSTQGVAVDFNNIDALAKHLQGVDCVIHLIGRAHILKDKDQDNDAVFDAVNVDITRKVIEACRKASVKRFIYMSSVIVMGLLRDEVLTEESECRPQTAYGRSKLKAENAVKELCPKYNIDYCILRSPLIYGPGNKANMFRLLKLVDKGLPLPLGKINNKRSFAYVDNIVDALIALANYDKRINATFLASDKEIVSTPELLKMIAKALRKPCRIFNLPLRLLKLMALINKGAIERLTGSLAIDASRLEKFLEAGPRYSMEQGLAVTAGWYKSLVPVGILLNAI